MATRLSLFALFVLVFSGCGQISIVDNENVFEDFSDYEDSDNNANDNANGDFYENDSSDFDSFDHDLNFGDEDIGEKPEADGGYQKYKFLWTLVKEEEELAHIFSRGAQNNAAIVFKDKFYILSGGEPSFVLQSEDAVTWTVLLSENLPLFSGQGTVAIHKNQMFALTESGLFSSEDGVKWDLQQLPEGIGIRKGWSITSWSGYLWIAGGYSENITATDLWYSGNGKTWKLNRVFDSVVAFDKGLFPWEAENGLAGMSFFKTDDDLFLFGGHAEKKVAEYNYSGKIYDLQIFGYPKIVYRINKEKLTRIHEIFDDSLGITNAVAFRYADKNWVTGGQIFKSDEHVQGIGPGNMIDYFVKNDPVPHFFMKKSEDFSNWAFDDAVLPKSVEKLPVILYHDEKVWILGAENSSEIWSGGEQLFKYDNEEEFICSRGEYNHSTDVVIRKNEDVLEYKGFTKIKNLKIEFEVGNLSPLFCLKEVDILEIKNTAKLKSLKGLTNITKINKRMHLTYTTLKDVEMTSLEKVGELMQFHSNSLLKSIKIDNLGKFPTKLDISGNGMLEEVDIQSSESELSMDEVIVKYNPNFKKNNFTEKIVSVLNIEIEKVSASAVVFPKLEYSGKINLKEIFEDEESRAVFPKLKEAEKLEISFLAPWIFPVLERVNDYLRMSGNEVSTEDENFPALTYIGGKLQFVNIRKSEISGFNSLETVGGFFLNNSAIEKVSGFDSLTTISDSFSATNNLNLKDFSGFMFLNRIQEPSINSIIIESNKLLQNIDALDVIRKISHIRAFDNNSLVDISALKNCTAIGDDFKILFRGAGVLPVSQAKLITDHFISLGASREAISFSECFESPSCE
ncbi:MAG: hypothetical protein ACOX2F_06485 [bacterium]